MLNDLKQISKNVRKKIVKMSHYSKSAHLGPALSCADILVYIYFKLMKDDDRFILSKGHAAMALYAVLSEKNIIPKEWLKEYSTNGAILGEHPSPNIPGVSIETGSLGHGLSVSVGSALGRKIKGNNGIEYVLIGDGECNEGSVWEAAAFAAHHKLGNLMVFLDKNNFQATNMCDKVFHTFLAEKWKAFGWNVVECYGNSVESIHFVSGCVASNKSQLPTIIICETTKGSGVSFAENNLEWHYRSLNKEELEMALEEIDNA